MHSCGQVFDSTLRHTNYRENTTHRRVTGPSFSPTQAPKVPACTSPLPQMPPRLFPLAPPILLHHEPFELFDG